MKTVKGIFNRQFNVRARPQECYYRVPDEEIRSEVRTGDLIAFGYCGSHFNVGGSIVHGKIRSLARKAVPPESWTAYTQIVTHVGLIVRNDVFPGANGDVYVLESTMGGVLNDGVKEFRGKTKFGVQLRRLSEVLDAVQLGHNNTTGMVAWIFEPKTQWNANPKGDDILLFRTLMHEHLDHGYDGPLSLLMHTNALPKSVREWLLRKSPFTSSRETCSELVANITTAHTGYGIPHIDAANSEFTYPAHLVSAGSLFNTEGAWRIFYPRGRCQDESFGVTFTPRYDADRGNPIRRSYGASLSSSPMQSEHSGSPLSSSIPSDPDQVQGPKECEDISPAMPCGDDSKIEELDDGNTMELVKLNERQSVPLPKGRTSGDSAHSRANGEESPARKSLEVPKLEIEKVVKETPSKKKKNGSRRASGKGLPRSS